MDKKIGELEQIEPEAQALPDVISMDREEKIENHLRLNSRFHEIIGIDPKSFGQ